MSIGHYKYLVGCTIFNFNLSDLSSWSTLLCANLVRQGIAYLYVYLQVSLFTAGDFSESQGDDSKESRPVTAAQRQREREERRRKKKERALEKVKKSKEKKGKLNFQSPENNVTDYVKVTVLKKKLLTQIYSSLLEIHILNCCIN